MKPSKKHKITVEDADDDNDDSHNDNDNDKENKLVDSSHTGCDKGMKNYTMQELWKLLSLASDGLLVCSNKWNTFCGCYNK